MQEVQIGRGPLLLTARGRPDPRHVPPHAAMDVRVARPIAPAQVRVQRVARDVAEQPVGALLDERQSAQPLEQAAASSPPSAVRSRSSVVARVCAHTSSAPVTLARDVRHEALQQHAEHVRRPAEIAPQPARSILALGEHVDQQRTAPADARA